MVFSSYVFLFGFLPLALALYFAAPVRLRHLVLTLLSYAFYGWANPLFVVLMLGSTVVDFICGLTISRGSEVPLDPLGPRSRRQRTALAVSILANLSLLGFFKYFGFATRSWDALVTMLGAEGMSLEVAFDVALPLGISFYTFQSMSYTIDVYRGHAPAVRNPIDFACYVSMFPQLVAGPIIRYQEVAEQLRSRAHTIQKFARGFAFLSLGLAKKVLIANHVGKIADVAFAADVLTPVDAWYGVSAYAFQIYFDFSGYSDMAIGLGLMLGFEFPKNFDAPYRSQSITEFWRRWHISLSSWLRDYLYVPLGGNQKGARRTYANLMIVMLLGGLWHGASWNFVIWGAIHGGWLAFERLQGKAGAWRFLPGALRIVTTFVVVLIAWVFFRAATLEGAVDYLGAMFGAAPAPGDGARLVDGVIWQPFYVSWMVVAAVVTWGMPQTWTFSRVIGAGKAALLLALFAVSVIVLSGQSFNPFIYFIF